jgi:hypothetical protein
MSRTKLMSRKSLMKPTEQRNLTKQRVLAIGDSLCTALGGHVLHGMPTPSRGHGTQRVNSSGSRR